MTRRYFTIGFTGATTEQAEDWSVRHVSGDTVVLPMAGSGRDIAAFARTDRTIWSWDPQPLSALSVDVFASKPRDPKVIPHDAREHGWAYRTRQVRGMPDDVAAWIDAVMLTGTSLDRLAGAAALLRCLFFRNRSQWGRDASLADLVRGYRGALVNLAPYQGLDGRFVHTRGSVFDDPAFVKASQGATVYVDPPKVMGGTDRDVYSGTWDMLNGIIAQGDVTLPVWTEDAYRRDMPKVWSSGWSRLIQFHATDCRPDEAGVEQAMAAAGVPMDQAVMSRFDHAPKTDIVWLIDR